MRKFHFLILAPLLIVMLASCIVTADAPSGQNPMQNVGQDLSPSSQKDNMGGHHPTPAPTSTPTVTPTPLPTDTPTPTPTDDPNATATPTPGGVRKD